MSNLNKIDVPIALEHKSKLDLSCSHATTMSFMTPQPVNYRHMIKGEHISLNCKSVVRPAPIEVPVFGNLKQNIRFFFVPYRLVFPNWDSFYNDVIASNYSDSSLVDSPPILPNDAIINFLIMPGVSSVVESEENSDFTLHNTFYKLEYFGRFALKILRSLGYEPLFAEKYDSFNFNALALLAFTKCYVDWYANSQYLNSNDVLHFERLVKFNDPTSTLQITTADLLIICSLLRSAVYDNEDYYVNAWDNPVAPNSGQYSAFTFADPTTNNGVFVSTNSLGTPEMFTEPGGSIGTTYIHEALKRLTDFQKRHALAGARAIDRVLAQYGVITDSLKLQRSIYLGNLSTEIEIGSVYATADSSNSVSSSSTGDYSGAGFGDSEKTIDFKCDEEGILLCIATIVPEGRLVQGYDRNNRHISKTDFFVPEFDSLGVQAIERGEVYVSQRNSFALNADDYSRVFGFSGRYGEYKRPKSFLTGDFSLPNFYSGGLAWNLYRIISDSSFEDGIDSLVHSLSFTRGSDSGQYNRIFQYTLGDYDPFYCFLRFQIASFAPCKPLFETYDFESDSKRVPTENGNKVN